MDNVLVFIPLIGSGMVIIGSVLINVYNRVRRPIQEPVVELPVVVPPVVLKHSRSYDELKSFYQSIRGRHNNTPPEEKFNI